MDEPRADATARRALLILTAMNLLNYVDRYVPSAVKDDFKRDLGLSDAETSWPLTAFVLVYMVASPLFGALADRVRRPVLIAAGVALWSLATAGAALAQGFATLLLARALVGIGEAAYATLAPPLLADLYPPERRNTVLTWFYVAIPLGSALGFAVGGWLGAHYGWRAAFLACGLPGLAAAALALTIADPQQPSPTRQPDADDGWLATLRSLIRNPAYLYAVAGYTAVTFAAGGLADWLPTFLHRVHGMALGEAGTAVGTATVVGGLGGTAFGGWLGERLVGKTRHPYLALSGWTMVPATLLAGAALVVPSGAAAVACVAVAQFFLWCYNGPINAEIVNSTSPQLRARAFSLSILAIHLLGDAISPLLIGAVSDSWGNLRLALAMAPLAMAVGAAVWLTGARRP